MQELLAIPDSQRSDEEWDELNELEISMAPGNRLSGPELDQSARRNDGPSRRKPPRQPHSAKGGNGNGNSNSNGNGNSNGGGQEGKRPSRKFHRKPANKAPAAS